MADVRVDVVTLLTSGLLGVASCRTMHVSIVCSISHVYASVYVIAIALYLWSVWLQTLGVTVSYTVHMLSFCIIACSCHSKLG